MRATIIAATADTMICESCHRLAQGNLRTGDGATALLVEVSGSISADTGSGDVTGENLTVGANLVADTGSGDVKLAGDPAVVTPADPKTDKGWDIAGLYDTDPILGQVLLGKSKGRGFRNGLDHLGIQQAKPLGTARNLVSHRQCQRGS